MTFKVWLKKLKKATNGLQYGEQGKIISYYEELYLDKLDEGFSEREIVKEFGPAELAANRILSDSYGGSRSQAGILSDRYGRSRSQTGVLTDNYGGNRPRTAQRRLRGGRVAFMAVMFVLFGAAVIGIAVALWATVLSLVVAGIGVAAAGIWTVVASVAAMTTGGTWLFYLGSGLICLGIGIIISIVAARCFKPLGLAARAFFRAIGRFIRPMEVR